MLLLEQKQAEQGERNKRTEKEMKRFQESLREKEVELSEVKCSLQAREHRNRQTEEQVNVPFLSFPLPFRVPNLVLLSMV